VARSLPILRRRAFTVLSVLSLLLCLATVALWVLSYWFAVAVAEIRYFPPDAKADTSHVVSQRFTDVGINRGTVMIARTFRSVTIRPVDAGWNWITRFRPKGITLGDSLMNRLGFGLTHEESPGFSMFRLVLPVWTAFPFLLLLPVLWLARWRGRLRAGLCHVCGYDLRATPEGCPECGTVND